MEKVETFAAQPRGRSRRRALARSLLLAVIASAGFASGAAAQVGCGGTIVPGQQVTLQADLTCDDSEFALTVVGPAVLDLNGFTLACADQNANGDEVIVGIALQGAGAVVRNGAVRDCRQAVFVAGEGRHTVEVVSALFSSSDGFRLDSDRNRIVDTIAFGNGGTGYSVQGKANLLAGNAAVANRDGFDVEQRNTLETNVASSNARTGFMLRSRSGRITGNRASDNLTGFAVRGIANRLEGNQAEDNSTGIHVEGLAKRNVLLGNAVAESRISGFVVDGEGNRLLQNRSERNGAHGVVVAASARRIVVRTTFARGNGDEDLSDSVAGCGTTRWRNNDFATSNQTCIE